jgi:hypothetical protein
MSSIEFLSHASSPPKKKKKSRPKEKKKKKKKKKKKNAWQKCTQERRELMITYLTICKVSFHNKKKTVFFKVARQP